MNLQQQESRQGMTPSQKFIFFGCFYSFFVNGGLALVLGAILPYMRAAYQLDYVTAGILLSAHSVGNLISSFIAGILPTYLGRKRSIILLCSSGAIAFALMTITSNSYLLILAFALTGINRGAVSNFNNGAINEIATGKGGALNVLHSMFAVGAFVSPFIAMLFVSIHTDGWKYVALLWSLFCFIELFTYGFMDIPERASTRQDGERKLADFGFLKNKFFLTACGILFFYLCAEQAVNGWLVTYFIESGILNAQLAQSMSSLLWLVILFGRLLTAYLTTRMKKSQLMLYSAIGYVGFFCLLLSSRTVVPVVIGIVGVGFCMSGMYPTTIASVGTIIKDYPIGLSILLTIAGMGSILMPSIVGTVAEHIGIIGGMSTVIVAVVITLILIIYNAYIYRGVD